MSTKNKEWCDWSDLMRGRVGEPEHPLSKPVKVGPVLRKGEIPRRPSDAEIRAVILGNNDAKPQPTDHELFGHLVPTEAQLQKAERDWNEVFQDHFNLLRKPVDDQNSKENVNWGNGKSFNDSLSPEELAKRNSYTDENNS